MVSHSFLSRMALALFAGALANTGYAQAQSAEDFYSSRNVILVVSSDAGGTTGLYGRTISEFLGRHIPGQPTVVMQFMSGGGQLILDQSGEVIGAIGITGDVNEMDDECAFAGIRSAGFEIDPVQYKGE